MCCQYFYDCKQSSCLHSVFRDCSLFIQGEGETGDHLFRTRQLFHPRAKKKRGRGRLHLFCPAYIVYIIAIMLLLNVKSNKMYYDSNLVTRRKGGSLILSVKRGWLLIFVLETQWGIDYFVLIKVNSQHQYVSIKVTKYYM